MTRTIDMRAAWAVDSRGHFSITGWGTLDAPVADDEALGLAANLCVEDRPGVTVEHSGIVHITVQVVQRAVVRHVKPQVNQRF